MSKSRIAPGYCLFQLVIQDFNHRKPPPKNYYIDKKGKRAGKVEEETIPVMTKLKRAKNGRRAIAWARKFGSVISCRKVDSHIHRLNMIDYLRIEPKPIEVNITPEEFIVGHDLEVSPTVQVKEVDDGDIDK